MSFNIYTATTTSIYKYSSTGDLITQRLGDFSDISDIKWYDGKLYLLDAGNLRFYELNQDTLATEKTSENLVTVNGATICVNSEFVFTFSRSQSDGTRGLIRWNRSTFARLANTSVSGDIRVMDCDENYVYFGQSTINSLTNRPKKIEISSNTITNGPEFRSYSPNGLCLAVDQTKFYNNSSGNAINEFNTAGSMSYIRQYAIGSTTNPNKMSATKNDIFFIEGSSIRKVSLSDMTTVSTFLSGTYKGIAVGFLSTSITTTPDTLNFGTQKTFIPSTSQSVDVEFVGAFTAVAITPPAGFKVSKDNSTWSSVAEYATAEDETKTVYLRAYSETAGTFNGNAVISTDEIDDVNIALTLTVENQPIISTTITAPTGVEISLDQTTWETELTLQLDLITPVDIYARIPTTAPAVIDDDITIITQGAADASLAVTGEVVQVAVTFTAPVGFQFRSGWINTPSEAQECSVSVNNPVEAVTVRMNREELQVSLDGTTWENDVVIISNPPVDTEIPVFIRQYAVGRPELSTTNNIVVEAHRFIE